MHFENMTVSAVKKMLERTRAKKETQVRRLPVRSSRGGLTVRVSTEKRWRAVDISRD